MKIVVAIGLVAALAGCTVTDTLFGIQRAPEPVPCTPSPGVTCPTVVAPPTMSVAEAQRRAVAALELGLTAADQAILDYAALPRCTKGASPICSSHTVIQNLKAAARDALTSIQSAEAAVAVGGSTFDAAMAGAQASLVKLQSALTQTKGP